MKAVPFLTSTVVSALCLVLSIVYFAKAASNRSVKADLVVQQSKNQQTQETIRAIDKEGEEQGKLLGIQQGLVQNRQALAQMRRERIERGLNISRLLQPILLNTGYRAAKNNNEKLKSLLKEQKWESFIFKPEDLQRVEEQIKAQAQAQGAAPAAGAAAAPRPAAPATTPAPR